MTIPANPIYLSLLERDAERADNLIGKLRKLMKETGVADTTAALDLYENAQESGAFVVVTLRMDLQPAEASVFLPQVVRNHLDKYPRFISPPPKN